MHSMLPLGLLASLLISAPLGIAAADITGTGHRFFAADYDKHVMAIVGADGKVEWKRKMEGGCHDAWVLPDGRILWTPSGDKIFEIDPKTDRETLVYDSRTHGGSDQHVEIHAFHPHADGTITVFESGAKRAVEIDRSGKVLSTVSFAFLTGDAHHQTRNARKLANGNHLLALSAEAKLVEVDPSGKIIWEFATGNECYSAIRLANGNTLVGGGHNHKVIEVDQAGKEVWSVGQKELPGITLGYVAQVQRLKNGNTVIINCHAGPKNPQIIEVDQAKQVVWSYRDFENFGNALPVGFVLDDADAIR